MYQKWTVNDLRQQENARQLHQQEQQWQKERAKVMSEQKRFDEHATMVRALWLMTLPYKLAKKAVSFTYGSDLGLHSALKSEDDYEQKFKALMVSLVKYHQTNPGVKLCTHQGSVFHSQSKVSQLESMSAQKVYETATQEQWEQWKVRYAQVVDFWVRLGYDINEPNEVGRTALHSLSFNGNATLVQLLVHASATLHAQYVQKDKATWAKLVQLSLECKDMSDDTPLMDACASGNEKLIQALLDFGADPAQKNRHAQSMYDIAKMRGKTQILNICMAFFERQQLAKTIQCPEQRATDQSTASLEQQSKPVRKRL